MAVDIDLLNSNSLTNIDTNFQRVKNALKEVVGREGDLPNHMNTDLDMNGSDILNAGSASFDKIILDGVELNNNSGYGWSPVFAAVARGPDIVFRLVDYVGGKSKKPTEFIGWYMGEAGFVQDINAATVFNESTGIVDGNKGDISVNSGLWQINSSVIDNEMVAPDAAILDTKLSHKNNKTGSILRSVNSVINEHRVSVKDFGPFVGIAGVDSTAAFNAAVDGGGIVWVPEGVYDLSGAVNINARTTIECDPRAVFNITHPTNTIFQAVTRASDFFRFHGNGAKFQSSVPRTGGAYIQIGGATIDGNIEFCWDAHVCDLQMTDHYRGIVVGSTLRTTIERIFASNASTEPGGYFISMGDIGRASESTIRDVRSQQADGTPMPGAGIVLGYCDVILLDGVHIIRNGQNVRISPTGAGKYASIVTINNSNIDTALIGVALEPSSGAVIQKLRIDNTWLGVHSDSGIKVNGTAGGFIEDTVISNSRLSANNIGVAIHGSSVSTLMLNNNIVCGSTNEGTIIFGGNNIMLYNNYIGPTVGSSDPNTFGLTVGVGVTGVGFGNRVINNTTADITNNAGAGFPIT